MSPLPPGQPGPGWWGGGGGGTGVLRSTRQGEAGVRSWCWCRPGDEGNTTLTRPCPLPDPAGASAAGLRSVAAAAAGSPSAASAPGGGAGALAPDASQPAILGLVRKLAARQRRAGVASDAVLEFSMGGWRAVEGARCVVWWNGEWGGCANEPQQQEEAPAPVDRGAGRVQSCPGKHMRAHVSCGVWRALGRPRAFTSCEPLPHATC